MNIICSLIFIGGLVVLMLLSKYRMNKQLCLYLIALFLILQSSLVMIKYYYQYDLASIFISLLTMGAAIIAYINSKYNKCKE